MRVLLAFILAIALLAYIQSERNDCYWHGQETALHWVACLIHF